MIDNCLGRRRTSSSRLFCQPASSLSGDFQGQMVGSTVLRGKVEHRAQEVSCRPGSHATPAAGPAHSRAVLSSLLPRLHRPIASPQETVSMSVVLIDSKAWNPGQQLHVPDFFSKNIFGNIKNIFPKF